MKMELEFYQKPAHAKGWYWNLKYYPIGTFGEPIKIPLEIGGYEKNQKRAEKEAMRYVELIQKANSPKTNIYKIVLDTEESLNGGIHPNCDCPICEAIRSDTTTFYWKMG